MVREYVGARYVPIYDGDWDNTKVYEPLTMVSVANVGTYTSKKYVPAGVDISDTEYWALSGLYSGQIASLENRVDTIENDLTNTITPDIALLQTQMTAVDTKLGSFWIDPDDYTGTDAQKIQAAYDDAVAITTDASQTYNATIVIKREFDLTGSTILLKNTVKAHSVGGGGYITFLGIGQGGFHKDDMDQPSNGTNFMFAKDPGHTGYTYRHRFINIRFSAPECPTTGPGYPDPTSTADDRITRHASVFRLKGLAWTYIENCYFTYVCYAFDGVADTDPSDLPVGLYCSNNHYIYCSGVFRGGAAFNACYFDHEEIGLCVVGFNFSDGASNVFVVRDCIIEYMYFYAFQFAAGGTCTLVTIENNYIEGCKSSVLEMASAMVKVFNFISNMLTIGGSGTDASSKGLRLYANATNRLNIDFNRFHAASNITTDFIQASATAAGSVNNARGNYFEGGGSGFVNINTNISSYINLD